MPNPVKDACMEIFRECFEGVAPGSNGTWFVQGNEAILNSLDALTPAMASRRVQNQVSTIGAHAYHLCYYLQLFNANCRAEEPKADWAGSWKVQEFDAKTWKALAEKTKHEFDEAMIWYKSSTDFVKSGEATYAIANLAHAAFHLGAIRALIPLVM